jgi:hemerythrin-like metal-binding protein
MDASDLYGVEELDSQHIAIYEAIDELSASVKAGRPGEETHPLLLKLYELLRFHFAVEVAVMEIMSYPHTAEHKDSHRSIMRDMEELIEFSIENGKLEDLGTSLETTFANGVFKHDKIFIEFVEAHREALTQSA